MSFYSHKWVKSTRKAKRCTWCNQWIPIGSTAWHFAGIHDDEFCSGKMHPECAAAADEVCDRDRYWESNGDYARGRIDDETQLPPTYLPTYRGKDREQHKAGPRE